MPRNAQNKKDNNIAGHPVVALIVLVLMVLCSGVICWRFCLKKQEITDQSIASTDKTDLEEDTANGNVDETKYYEII